MRTLSAPSITCALVIMWPTSSITTPEPKPYSSSVVLRVAKSKVDTRFITPTTLGRQRSAMSGTGLLVNSSE